MLNEGDELKTYIEILISDGMRMMSNDEIYMTRLNREFMILTYPGLNQIMRINKNTTLIIALMTPVSRVQTLEVAGSTKPDKKEEMMMKGERFLKTIANARKWMI